MVPAVSSLCDRQTCLDPPFCHLHVLSIQFDPDGVPPEFVGHQAGGARTEEGVEVYKDLVKGADAVVEAMRPGSLARRGLGYEDLSAVNPRIVFCNISGYGMTGPYQTLPSHGIAFDTWAGIINPAYDDEGFCYIPEHASIGMHSGPMMGALGILLCAHLLI